MMMNLFSMFDPSSSILNFSLNWLSIFLGLFLIPFYFWFLPNNLFLFFYKILNTLFFEFKIIINNKMNSFLLIIISFFILILMSNFISLFPYIFTCTSHLVLNLSLALPLWLSFFLFGWINKMNHMFIHLVPQGTPMVLIPFMICIESISSLIRPITLTIRLTANMIAGHLLMTLLGNLGPNLIIIFIPFLLIIQILLLTLESAVAIIQSYVFSVLLTLYYSEYKL